jgi:hypothetical protein
VWLQLSERKALLEPLVANRVEPKLVAEISYLTWTGNNLLRHTVNVGLRKTSRPTQVAGRRASLAGRNSVFYFTTLEQPATGRSRRQADIDGGVDVAVVGIHAIRGSVTAVTATLAER